MPRTHLRKVGSRPYRNYTDETLAEALNEIKSKKLSIRQAAEKYGIHRNTLWTKLKGKHEGPPGRPSIFTTQEENMFVAHCIATSTFGFPITTFDLRCIAKCYLDRLGRNIPAFKNNFPGQDWSSSFMGRHRILTERIAQNISSSRAATNEEVINKYFDNLEVELNGIPSSNIWNYDETNVVDDPGSFKVITKRGTKYPEKIRNSTKACTTLMFCGNAEGQLAPLYVNYKSKKLWTTWTEGGPEGVRYNCTKSGWFDYNVFEDWFTNLALPVLKRQEGTKVLIGDNLSSHLNIEVIRQCEQHNIKFIALPPNTTHLLQPLDVAFFRPVKRIWKSVLTEWKESAYGSTCSTIPKQEFPPLLKKLVEEVGVKGASNLKSGFRKCGIYPVNREEVLNRLCSRVMAKENSEVQDAVSNSFIEHLMQKRNEITEKRQKKRKRVNVPAGKSISSADVEMNPSVNGTSARDNDAQPGTSGVLRPENSSRKKQNKRNGKEVIQISSDESDDSDSIVYAESDDSPWDEDSDTNASDSGFGKSVPFDVKDKEIGNHVIVKFEDRYYPGVITKINKRGALISAMESIGKHWRWPQEKDEIWYADKEIVCKIETPRKMGKRDLFNIRELDQLL